MEPVSFGKRLLARVMGDPDLSGTHENAPDGFMLAYGTQVEPGRLVRGSVVDVAPTILYFLGLPVGRDVDGIRAPTCSRARSQRSGRLRSSRPTSGSRQVEGIRRRTAD